MEITILGSSASGVPQIDCMVCKACRSAIIKGGKNRRTMQSIAIKNKDGFTLIDADPDLRFQFEKEKLRLQDITEIFLTHIHGDHIFGLFQLSVGHVLHIPVYSKKEILDLIFKKSFDYLEQFGFAEPIPLKNEITLRGLTFIPFEVPHTTRLAGPTLGYKIKEGKKVLTYVPDIAGFTPEILNTIDNSDVLIFDGVFYDRPIAMHMPIVESIPFLKKLNLKEVYFTQMNHSEPPHEELEKLVKPYGYHIAYDGMKIRV